MRGIRKWVHCSGQPSFITTSGVQSSISRTSRSSSSRFVINSQHALNCPFRSFYSSTTSSSDHATTSSTSTTTPEKQMDKTDKASTWNPTEKATKEDTVDPNAYEDEITKLASLFDESPSNSTSSSLRANSLYSSSVSARSSAATKSKPEHPFSSPSPSVAPSSKDASSSTSSSAIPNPFAELRKRNDEALDDQTWTLEAQYLKSLDEFKHYLRKNDGKNAFRSYKKTLQLSLELQKNKELTPPTPTPNPALSEKSFVLPLQELNRLIRLFLQPSAEEFNNMDLLRETNKRINHVLRNMTLLGIQRDFYTYAMLIKRALKLSKNNDVDDNVMGVLKMMEEDGVELNKDTWENVISLLFISNAHQGVVILFENVLKQQQSTFASPDIMGYVLKCYCAQREFKKAEAVFESIPEENKVIDVYNYMMSAYIEHGKVAARGISLFEKLIFNRGEDGITYPKPNRTTYEFAMKGYLEANGLRRAEQLMDALIQHVEEMYKQSSSPSSSTSRTTGDAKSSGQSQARNVSLGIADILSKAKSKADTPFANGSEPRPIRNGGVFAKSIQPVIPTNRTYTLMMSHYGRREMWGHVYELYKSAKMANVLSKNMAKPTLITPSVFNLYMQSLRQLNKVDEAIHAINSYTEQHDFVPLESTYTVFLGLLSRNGRLQECQHYFRTMPFEPNLVMFTSLFEAFSAKGQDRDAMNIVEEIRSKGFRLDLHFYNTLIYHHACRGNVALVKNVLSEMVDAGIRPDARTYHFVLRALVVAGELEEIKVLLNTYEFSPADYGYLVHGVLKSGKLEEALQMLKIMVRQQVRPDRLFWYRVVSGLSFLDNLENRGGKDAWKIRTDRVADVFDGVSDPNFDEHGLLPMCKNKMEEKTVNRFAKSFERGVYRNDNRR